MGKFRMKPVTVEAIRVVEAHRAAAENGMPIPGWLREHYNRGWVLFLNNPRRVEIKSLAGWMTGDPEDWIIRRAAEIYLCKPNMFDATYEAVEDAL